MVIRARADRRRVDRRRGALPRRSFVGLGLAGMAGLLVPLEASSSVRRRGLVPPPAVKPPRLRPGDTVGLINPPRIPPRPDDLERITAGLGALDLKVRCAPTVLEPDSSDQQRARDVNALFADPGVKALLPLRGGWGSAAILPHIDYALVRRHPKVVMGYSDVVALLLALRSRAGLVTFHGPMGTSAWDPFTVRCLQEVLFEGHAAVLRNPADEGPAAIRTLLPGRARAPLLGGNLTVLASLVGSGYLAAEESIVFVEEVQEPISEVDRMLIQLEQGGVLARARGFVFGHCTACVQPSLDPSLTLERVLDERIRPLGIPAWSGAMIGHLDRQFCVPIGVPAEIDAADGTIRLLEPAVV